MKLIYTKPATFLISIKPSNCLLAGSGGPTEGLSNEPGYGGSNNGTHPVGAKQNDFSIWNDENEFKLP